MTDDDLRTLPPSAIIRLRAVLQRTGLTRPTLYRKIADGTFPRQVRISTCCVGWRQSEVDEWLRSPMTFAAAGADHQHLAVPHRERPLDDAPTGRRQ